MRRVTPGSSVSSGLPESKERRETEGYQDLKVLLDPRVTAVSVDLQVLSALRDLLACRVLKVPKDPRDHLDLLVRRETLGP